MLYQLKRTQLVKTDLLTCWEFFSSPANLKLITPDYMGFDVLTDVPAKMYEGLFIAYIVKPVAGIPMQWVTEITHVKDLSFFVDEQRQGPYTIWHHEHHFEETADGVLMTDIVSYVVPFGLLGRIANSLMVRKKIEEIFDFRYEKVEELFS